MMKLNYKITNITAHPFENKHIKKIILEIIGRLKAKDLSQTIQICDPFSNNKTTRMQGTSLVTNDLNPKFNSTYNLEANDFGELMEIHRQKFDLILFDPPYSLRQLKEQYEGIGMQLKQWQTKNMWGRCKNALAKCVYPGGYVISLGWNSSGFGRKRGFSIEEVHLFGQGGHEDRYDLIVTVEKKIQHTLDSFSL